MAQPVPAAHLDRLAAAATDVGRYFDVPVPDPRDPARVLGYLAVIGEGLVAMLAEVETRSAKAAPAKRPAA